MAQRIQMRKRTLKNRDDAKGSATKATLTTTITVSAEAATVWVVIPAVTRMNIREPITT